MSGTMNGATLPSRSDAVGARICALMDAIERRFLTERPSNAKTNLSDFTGKNKVKIEPGMGVEFPATKGEGRPLTARQEAWAKKQHAELLAKDEARIDAIAKHLKAAVAPVCEVHIERAFSLNRKTIQRIWPRIVLRLTKEEELRANFPWLPHYRRLWGMTRTASPSPAPKAK